jgi:hypothetical protein
MSSPTDAAPASPLHRSDRVALWAIAAIAGVVASIWVVIALIRTLGPTLFGQAIAVDLLLSDGRTGTSSVDGVTESMTEVEVVSVSAGAFSAGPITQIVATSTLQALIVGLVAAAIAVTIVRIAQGRPFQRSLYRLGLAAGGTLALGGLAVEGLGGGGRMVLANELNTRLGDERFVVGFTFDPTPIGIGFVIIALATVVLFGERLQRDTEGLV